MAKHKKTLSDTQLKRIKPPKQGRTEMGDTVVPGLVVRVTPRGTRTFSVVYKVPGETHIRPNGTTVGGVGPSGRLRVAQQHRVTLGQYPILSLKRAREEARKILETVSEGHDPRVERREQNLIRHTNTVEAITHRFIELAAKPKMASWRAVQRVLELHVLPSLGNRPIGDIRRADIHELLDDIVAKGRVGTAREVRKHLHRLFNWALDREIVAANPVHGIQRPELAQNREAGRSLTDDELRAIWNATGDMGYPFGAMYRMLLLTGQRRNDWANSQRSEIDSEKQVLEIPASRYKGRRDHVVPLAAPAWTIFEGLPKFTGDDYHLFSTRVGAVPVSGFSKAKVQLDALAQVLPYRVHDFRVTCETRLADLGIVQETRDAVLGHAKPGLQKTYNKHDYADEKRAALAAYAEHIMGVVR
jgi:integrase